MHHSSFELLVLHSLQVGGAASPEGVAGRFVLKEAEVEVALQRFRAAGFAREASGALSGWVLTPEGRLEVRRRLHQELVVGGLGSAVRDCYQQFLRLNPLALQICSRWQVRGGAPNSHDDPAYDRAVVAELVALEAQARPICGRLGSLLSRYGHYGPRLSHSVALVEAGHDEWFVKPTIPSFHTVWFELHTDLLATLGLDRSSENRNSP